MQGDRCRSFIQPANAPGVDPTHHSGLIILEFVTRLGMGRLALLVCHSLSLGLRVDWSVKVVLDDSPYLARHGLAVATVVLC